MTLQCNTPECSSRIFPWGREPHNYIKHARHVCESCGGVYDGETWQHVCAHCGRNVQPGELTGLFVPHNCVECERKITEQNIRNGNICGLCRQPRNKCCC